MRLDYRVGVHKSSEAKTGGNGWRLNVAVKDDRVRNLSFLTIHPLLLARFFFVHTALKW